jgi:beta-RFAP synthase
VPAERDAAGSVPAPPAAAAPTRRVSDPVEIEAHARLHFGFLDPSGTGARRFGGLGMAIAASRFVARFQPASRLVVEGDDDDRVAAIAAAFCERAGLRRRASIQVLETIPAHVGLGSGTQIALAVATGLARLHGIDPGPERICRLAGRARRSAVGFHLFQHGGLVIEAGHPREEEAAAGDPVAAAPTVPPLVARHEVPENWRVLLVVPPVDPSISGEREEEAFRRIGPASGETTTRIRNLALEEIGPAIAAGDLARFGAALEEIQDLVGACFAPLQGGLYHPAADPVVRRLREAGGSGAGQSSWGPAVYAFADGQEAAERLRSSVADVAPRATVRIVRPRNAGAVIRRL